MPTRWRFVSSGRAAEERRHERQDVNCERAPSKRKYAWSYPSVSVGDANLHLVMPTLVLFSFASRFSVQMGSDC